MNKSIDYTRRGIQKQQWYRCGRRSFCSRHQHLALRSVGAMRLSWNVVCTWRISVSFVLCPGIFEWTAVSCCDKSFLLGKRFCRNNSNAKHQQNFRNKLSLIWSWSVKASWLYFALFGGSICISFTLTLFIAKSVVKVR